MDVLYFSRSHKGHHTTLKHKSSLPCKLPNMSYAMLIDAHCHLDFPVFDADRDEILKRAKDKQIKHIVIPGTQKQYWGRINALCKQHASLHACYGLHPYWLKQHDKRDLLLLEKYIDNNRPVAIGECGLDFRKQQADKATQLFFFEEQLRLAEDCHLPAVIHSVNATQTVIEYLKKFKNIKAMIHSYSGSSEQAKQLIDMGVYISISSSVTYDNSKKIKSVVKNLPLTSLLLETDAPDQPGQSNKDQRNEPEYLLDTLNAIADLREESADAIALQTTENAKVLFSI